MRAERLMRQWLALHRGAGSGLIVEQLANDFSGEHLLGFLKERVAASQADWREPAGSRGDLHRGVWSRRQYAFYRELVEETEAAQALPSRAENPFNFEARYPHAEVAERVGVGFGDDFALASKREEPRKWNFCGEQAKERAGHVLGINRRER